ncbi:hypothetical protein ACWD4T_48515, partial [Streptomyces umbrinus]
GRFHAKGARACPSDVPHRLDVDAAIRDQALKALQPEVSALSRSVSLRRCVSYEETAGRQGNPVMHQVLERIFADGSFGNGAWLQRLAYKRGSRQHGGSLPGAGTGAAGRWGRETFSYPR